MPQTNTTRRKHRSEEGYTLLFVMFMLAVLTIWLSVAVPKVAKQIQRDHEVETMHRGKQYIRAVQLYYRKFHAYPPNADALNNTNEIRFLRKKYIDPTTGKDDWKPIRFGQNKTQTLGFFGQPLAGSTTVLAGIGPSGNGGLGGSPAMGMGGSPTGTGGGFGGTSIFSSTNGSGNNSTSGATPSPPGTNGTTGTAGNGGTNTNSGASGSSSIFGDSGSSNQTFGGAGIIGFTPASTKTSILIFKKKQHYNEWEFFYDPAMDLRTIAGNTGGIGQPISNTSTPIGSPNPSQGPNLGGGSDSGSGGNGPSSSPGPGTATPTPTPQPQQ